MHGLPLFRARSVHPVARRFALACALAVAGLTWAAPDVAEAYADAMALERPEIGRTGHSFRPKRVLRFLKHLPGQVRVLAMSVRKRLAKKKPALVAEDSLESGQPHNERAADPTKERSDRRQSEKQCVVAVVDDEPFLQDLLRQMLPKAVDAVTEVEVIAAGEDTTEVVVKAGIEAATNRGATLDFMIVDGLIITEIEKGRVVGEDHGWLKVVRAAKEAKIPCCVLSGTPALESKVREEGVPFFAKPSIDWKGLGACITAAVEERRQAN